MTLFKSAGTAALDDVMQAAEEAIEQMNTLVALHLDDSALESTLRRHGERLSAAANDMREQRQASGDLPAAGNVERAEIAAVAQKVRSFFSAETATAEIADHMTSSYRELADRIDAARDEIDDDQSLCRTLAQLSDLVAALRRELRDFV